MFYHEAVSAFTEIPRVGLNPPDPVWGGSCVAGDQGRGNGLETVRSWKIVRIRSVANQEISSGCWLRRERAIKPGGSGWPMNGPGGGKASAIGLPRSPPSFYFIHDESHPSPSHRALWEMTTLSTKAPGL